MRSEGRQHQFSRLGSCSCRVHQLEASHWGRHSDEWAEERGSVESVERVRQQRAASGTMEPGTDYTCSICNRACHSRIGLYSHSRCCNSITYLSLTYTPLPLWQKDANNIMKTSKECQISCESCICIIQSQSWMKGKPLPILLFF